MMCCGIVPPETVYFVNQCHCNKFNRKERERQKLFLSSIQEQNQVFKSKPQKAEFLCQLESFKTKLAVELLPISLLLSCKVIIEEGISKYFKHSIMACLAGCMIHSRSQMQVNGQHLSWDSGAQVMKGRNSATKKRKWASFFFVCSFGIKYIYTDRLMQGLKRMPKCRR